MPDTLTPIPPIRFSGGMGVPGVVGAMKAMLATNNFWVLEIALVDGCFEVSVSYVSYTHVNSKLSYVLSQNQDL